MLHYSIITTRYTIVANMFSFNQCFRHEIYVVQVCVPVHSLCLRLRALKARTTDGSMSQAGSQAFESSRYWTWYRYMPPRPLRRAAMRLIACHCWEVLLLLLKSGSSMRRRDGVCRGFLTVLGGHWVSSAGRRCCADCWHVGRMVYDEADVASGCICDPTLEIWSWSRLRCCNAVWLFNLLAWILKGKGRIVLTSRTL